MTDRLIHVSYKRAVSDGNYGTEAAEVYLEWHSEDDHQGNQDGEMAAAMLREAHGIVHAQLGQSRNVAVRRAVQPRTTAPSAATVPPDEEDLPF